MKNFRFTIKNKIYGGFMLMIIIFIANGIFSYFNVQNNNSIVKNASEIQRPSSKAINELSSMVTRSKMLITNWVYLQGNNESDKVELKDLIEAGYPELKRNIEELKVVWESDSQKVAMDTVLATFDRLIEVEKGVMSQLVTFENYEDPFTKLMAEDAITSEVLPMVTFMNDQLNVAESIQDGVTNKADDDQLAAAVSMKLTTLVSGIVMVVFGLLAAFFMAQSIVNPINYIKEVVLKMGTGELPQDEDRRFNNDEIGEMAEAMDKLIVGLRSTTLFAENIGKGIYDAEFDPLSEKDVLGNALIEMRANLKNVASEDEKRNWATEGLAKFGDILRSNNSDLVKLTDEIVRNLVKYLNANQGGLFVIDGDEGEEFLELKACYAWDKKKYLDQKIYKGDGLVGQSWQEMDSIYLTDVPNDYISITSGLGDANPTGVLIVPLKVNDEIFGVVEIASFNDFEDYEKEFVEKIAESIASTISTVRVNARTQILLEDSQQMTEQMRAQEEEMRQNMEELQATQEEMQREGLSMEGFLTAVNQSVANIEYNVSGEIIMANNKYLTMVGYSMDELLGKPHRIFVGKEELATDDYRIFWQDLTGGMTKTGIYERYNKSGEKMMFETTYSPIKDTDGNILKIIAFTNQLQNNEA
jgi:PAS domain S-box-containing protein